VILLGRDKGNRVEIVGYDNIQFTKAPNVLRGMGLMHLAKNEKAKKELAEKVLLGRDKGAEMVLEIQSTACGD
jgi:hypothetical protein